METLSQLHIITKMKKNIAINKSEELEFENLSLKQKILEFKFKELEQESIRINQLIDGLIIEIGKKHDLDLSGKVVTLKDGAIEFDLIDEKPIK